MLLSPSPSADFSGSHSGNRRPPSLPRLLWGICCAIGFLFAVNGFIGETLYRQARLGMSVDGSAALWKFNQASILFPIEYRLREGDAVYKAIQEGIPPDIALEGLKEVLRTDPNSPNLWFFVGVQKARMNDKDGVREALAKLERLAPMWANTEMLRKTEAAL